LSQQASLATNRKIVGFCTTDCGSKEPMGEITGWIEDFCRAGLRLIIGGLIGG